MVLFLKLKPGIRRYNIYMNYSLYSKGLTLIEILLMIAVSGLLIVALSLLLTRIFAISREQSEQARANQEATDESRRISRALESARNVSPVPTKWLVGAGPYSIKFYTNVDDDENTEIVRYYTDDGSSLKRGVTQLDANNEVMGSEEVAIVAKYIRNLATNQPLFTYTTDEQGTVQSVTLNLVVDVDTRHYPRAVIIKTDAIVPRQPLLGVGEQSKTIVEVPGQPRVAAVSAFGIPVLFCPLINVTLINQITMCTTTATPLPSGGAAEPTTSCLYAGASPAGVYTYSGTADTEGSWVGISALPSGSEVRALVNYLGFIYAGTDTEVYRLDGESWTATDLPGGANTFELYDSKLYAGTDTGVFEYEGSGWTSSGIPGGEDYIETVKVGALKNYAGRLYASVVRNYTGQAITENEVYYLEDGASTEWKKTTEVLNQDKLPYSLENSFDGKLYAAIGNLVYSSYGTSNWQQASAFGENGQVKSLFSDINTNLLYGSVDSGGGVGVWQYNGGTEWAGLSIVGDATSSHKLFTYDQKLCIATGGETGKVYCKDSTDTWLPIGETAGAIGTTTKILSTALGDCAITSPSPSPIESPTESPTELPSDIPILSPSDEVLVNTAPVALDDTYFVSSNTALNIFALPVAHAKQAFFSVDTPGVLQNDFDSDNDLLTAHLASSPTHKAQFSLGVDGSFIYKSKNDFIGQDSFTYYVNDGTENSNVVTVTINITD